MRLAAHKLPITTKFVTRAESGGGVDEGHRESEDLADTDLEQKLKDRVPSCSTCGSSLPPGSWTTPVAIATIKRDIARLHTEFARCPREAPRQLEAAGDESPEQRS